MTIRVRLFARARDLAGADELLIDVSPGATVQALRGEIARIRPALAALLPRCAFAVDSELADDARPLSGENEVALLPPVSGG